ncbi:MAG: hypothetical protein ACK5W1_03300 [Flavobacteriales bacterium]
MAEIVNLLQTAMLAIFGKKKINTERVAHMFAHNILETVESGFPDIAGFINDSPEFVRTPPIEENDYGRFLMIVIAGNFSYIPQHYTDGQDKEIIAHSVSKFAPVFGMTEAEFSILAKEYKDFMGRVNSPSKNTLYAMSKAVFFKYDLNDYQDEYFRMMKTPNPIFLKNLDELMRNFLWDWEAFNDRYKVVSQPAA